MPSKEETAYRLARIAEMAIESASKTVIRSADEALKAGCGPEFLRAVETNGQMSELDCFLGKVRMNRLQRGV
jgi:hypothetical protein